MRGLAFAFALHFSPGAQSGDHWFSADKAQHFLMAAFVESVSFSALRTTRLSRSRSLVGAATVAGVVSVGKEAYDQRYGGDPSLKDLTWDAAGMAAAALVLGHTKR